MLHRGALRTLLAVTVSLVLLTLTTSQAAARPFLTVRPLYVKYDPTVQPVARVYPGQNATIPFADDAYVINLIGQRYVDGEKKYIVRKLDVEVKGEGYHFRQRTRHPNLSVTPAGEHRFQVKDTEFGINLLIDVDQTKDRIRLQFKKQ